MRKLIILSMCFLFAFTVYAQQEKKETTGTVQNMQQADRHIHRGLGTVPVFGSHDPKFMPPHPERKRFFDFRAAEEKGIDKFRTEVQTRIVYPEEAIKNNIQGTVWVYFVVKNGKITSANIIKGVNVSLDKEVMQVIVATPWPMRRMPGTRTFSMPLEFILK